MIKRYGPYQTKAGYLLYTDVSLGEDGRRVSKTILAHREIMERHVGRKLGPKEVVHHKNEIPSDNRTENLEVMAWSEHARHHSKTTEVVRLTCIVCGLEFDRPARVERRRRSKPKAGPMCSKSCVGKYVVGRSGSIRPLAVCGTVSAYSKGCRCDACRKAHADHARAWRASKKT